MIKNTNEFDREIKKLYKHPVLDGITNIKKYKRILWILKECNKQEPYEEWNHRDFHLDHANGFTSYKLWRKTYQPILFITYGIIENNYEYSDIPNIGDDGLIAIEDGNRINYLENIAIININKSGGGSLANQSSINRSYSDNSEFIKKQIRGMEPDIIINASRCDQLFKDLSMGSKVYKKKSSSLKYSTPGNQIIIDYYHPNQKTVSEEKYCNDILKTLKSLILNSK